MHLDISRKDLYTRGGIIDQILESAFDAAALIDCECNTIFANTGLCQVWDRPIDEILNQPIIDTYAIDTFNKVLTSGIANFNISWIVNGHQAIATQIPIYDNGIVIGLLATLKLIKNSHLKELLLSPERTLHSEENTSELYDAMSRRGTHYTFKDYIGDSPQVKALLALCKNAAKTKFPILLFGETGTGKELLAHAIHSFNQSNANIPFIRINCTAIPADLLESELFGYEKGAFTGAQSTKKGKFELAQGGSILLDEIGDLDLRLQGKLLRVLEEREFERIGGNRLIPFNARIIASTNRNLHDMCTTGQFRMDLYFRLNALEIEIPPLRERIEDLPLLISALNRNLGYNLKFSDDALSLMTRYRWPGNVRHLKNVLTRCSVSFGEAVITERDLLSIVPRAHQELFMRDANIFNAPALKNADSVRKNLIDALEDCGYNITMTATRLGISRSTLYHKIQKYDIEVPRLLHGGRKP